MKNSEKFKKQFLDFKGVIDYYTDDSEQLNFIDVEADEVDYTKTFQLSCGCCSDVESNTGTLSYIMDGMRDQDFKMLCGTAEKFSKIVGSL